jgi:hypothetical protein
MSTRIPRKNDSRRWWKFLNRNNFNFFRLLQLLELDDNHVITTINNVLNGDAHWSRLNPPEFSHISTYHISTKWERRIFQRLKSCTYEKLRPIVYVGLLYMWAYRICGPIIYVGLLYMWAYRIRFKILLSNQGPSKGQSHYSDLYYTQKNNKHSNT